MAVDTQQKRYAMLNFGRDTDLLPPPDTDIDKIDRLMLVGLYVHAIGIIPGPYCVKDFTIFVPGDDRSVVFTPGDSRSTMFVPGDDRRTVQCDH